MSTARSARVKVTSRMASSPCPSRSSQAGRSRARTGPKRTLKPQPRVTSRAVTPGAASCGRISRRWLTTSASRLRRTTSQTSLAEKVPLPAAHQTFMPRVSVTSSQASIPLTLKRRLSKESL